MKTGSTLIALALLLSGTAALAQTKIKDGSLTGTPALPNSNAILELESNTRGLMLPRVALTDTSLAAPLTAHVKGMVVYDTATHASTGIAPGIYYNNGSKWIATSASAAVSNGWLLTGNAGTVPPTTIGAAVGSGNYLGTTDAQNLALAINGTTRMIFDQFGNAYGGDGSTSVQTLATPIANNNSRNFVWGNSNQITTNDANGGARANAVFGASNKVIGDYFGTNLGAQNLVSGSANTAVGSTAFIGGTNNSDSAISTLLMGDHNIAGRFASTGAAIGQGLNITQMASQVALGKYNVDTATALFAVGNGSALVRSNAITVTPAGWLGINNKNNPAQVLEVNGQTQIDTLLSGALTDSLVTANASGVLRKISAANFATSNIYTADGILGTNRTVTLNGKSLQFFDAASNGSTTFTGAVQTIYNSSATGRSTLGLSAGTSSLYLFQDGNNAGQLTTTGTSLNIGTLNTAPITMFTSNVERFKISSGGNVGIGGVPTPNSTLQVAGAVSLPYVFPTSNVTLDNTYHTVRAQGGCTQITFPDATTCAGRIYTIINSNGHGTVTLTTQNSQYIYEDVGNITFTSIGGGTRITVQSDGTGGWIVIGR